MAAHLLLRPDANSCLDFPFIDSLSPIEGRTVPAGGLVHVLVAIAHPPSAFLSTCISISRPLHFYCSLAYRSRTLLCLVPAPLHDPFFISILLIYTLITLHSPYYLLASEYCPSWSHSESESLVSCIWALGFSHLIYERLVSFD